jgi:nicotinate phosphoribosyltransferase
LEVVETAAVDAPLAVRLDSGDLLALSKQTRRVLDEAGREDGKIVASGGLDEFDVKQLLDAGAPIDIFGVGTRIGVSADAPSLDTAYKLVEYGGRPVMKLSTGKQTRPGPKQVHRGDLGDGDILSTRGEATPHGRVPLLTEVMHGGERLLPAESTEMLADRLSADLARLPVGALDLREPSEVPVRVSSELQALTRSVAETHRLRGRRATSQLGSR